VTIAEKREAIERKFAKKEQSIAAGKALISGAEVVLNAAKTQPYVPAGLIATILALGQTAAQIAVIKSQKFATGGVLTGQSHAQGGVPIEAEGGEVIINKRSASLFRDELSNINSYKGYGVAFAERGMLVPRQSSLPNYDAIISKTINAVSKIPVTLTEREITGIQNHVKVLENEGNCKP